MGCVTTLPQVQEPDLAPQQVHYQPAFHPNQARAPIAHVPQREPSPLIVRDPTPPLPPNNYQIHHIPSPLQPAPSIVDTTLWTTADLIAFLCSINGGKLCAAQYDAFKASLFSMGINGQTMCTLSDAQFLSDLGITDPADLDLIQQTIMSLCSKQQESPALELVDDDFFPSEWTFPMESGETLGNRHYVGERLIIRSQVTISPMTSTNAIDEEEEEQQQEQQGVESIDNIDAIDDNNNCNATPYALVGRVVYVENNWIVVEYPKEWVDQELDGGSNDNLTLQLSQGNEDNVDRDGLYEKIHVMYDEERIHKIKYDDDAANCTKTTTAVDDEGLFEIKAKQVRESIFDDEGYRGMSYQISTDELVTNVVPQCYVDPITYEIMLDPVTSVSSGRTYDRSVIERHLDDYGFDPFTQEPLRKDELRSNALLKRAIKRYLKHNPDLVTPQ